MKGKLIVIESGSDASGKATQAGKLKERLQKNGHNVMGISFPDYESDSSALVKMYLKGDFGTAPDSVNAYAASTFYAVDRYASYKTKWGEFLNAGGIVVLDRYTTSNMVHQASKIADLEERTSYIDWLSDLEFDKLGLPRPDLVLFLDVPVEVSFKLMENRANKIDGSAQKDIHETDKGYLERSYQNALWVSTYQKWERVTCTDEDGHMKSIDDIHEVLWKCVESHL